MAEERLDFGFTERVLIGPSSIWRGCHGRVVEVRGEHRLIDIDGVPGASGQAWHDKSELAPSPKSRTGGRR